MKTTTLAGIAVGAGHPVRIMGVINASPESFFQGSVHTNTRAIKDSARRMEQDGADMIDVGAMSTAPYLKTHISEQEESRRLTRAIESVASVTRLPISVDSSRATPALTGLNAGAVILNDITGLAGDPTMAGVAKKARGVILMAHPRSRAWMVQDSNPIATVRRILADGIHRATVAGIPRSRIVVDPGIGFFRNERMAWWKWDVTVLRELNKLRTLEVPLLVGVSRKSFIGEILKRKNPNDRLAGSLAATAVAVLNGAAIIRTHDVKETKDVVKVLEASGLCGDGRVSA